MLGGCAVAMGDEVTKPRRLARQWLSRRLLRCLAPGWRENHSERINLHCDSVSEWDDYYRSKSAARPRAKSPFLGRSASAPS